jgi:hypothetical protein
MKSIITLLVLILLVGCIPVKVVNVERKHNYYQRHRTTTYTSPIWIPGHGIVLQTHKVRLPKSRPNVRRGKH